MEKEITHLGKNDVFKMLDRGIVSVTEAQAIKEYIKHLLKLGSNQEKRRGTRK